MAWLALSFDEEAYRRARLAASQPVTLPIPSPAAADANRVARLEAPPPSALDRQASPATPPQAEATAPAAERPPRGEAEALEPEPPEQPYLPPASAAPAREQPTAALPDEEDAAPKAAASAPGDEEEQRVALALAPDPDLVVQTDKGPLPVIAPDGRQAWQVYRRPFNERSSRPRVAIVVAGMGLSRSATNAAIQQLPSAVTLAFAPYAADLDAWIQMARAAGHEVMLQLPMEPVDYPATDPGPHALLTSLTVADNIDRLEWLLSRFTGYIGVTNYMGSRFTSSPDHVRPVLSVLKQRGLMFLDSRSSRDSVVGAIAEEIGLPRALNNRFIDGVAARPAIDARLNELERIALATRYAIGIGFPYPVTIERIAAWADGLAGKGLELTPVSAVVNKQTG